MWNPTKPYSYGNLEFSPTLGKLTGENIKFTWVTGSSFSFVFWLCYCVHGILTENGYQVGNDLACGSVFDVLDWDQYSTIDVRRYCLEIMSIWQYEGLVCHEQIPLFSCRHVSLADFSTWLCLGLKLIEDCSSAGLWEWPFQNKFFIGEINIWS